MTEEHEHAAPHSDHAAHTAPAEPHPIKKNLWQKWMAWSGSFFVISLLLHIFLIGGATLVVVQVIQGRKEKLKFTAPPPSAAGPSEHKVKPSKKTAAAAPAISKRITSTAANASIALPAMEMSSSTGPDVMASVMSGMGASGLGAGAAGGAGMASMPLAGLTAFGFKGSGGGGLKGHFYDLKQTVDRKPTGIQDDSKHFAVFDEFFSKGWDETVLQKFYQAKDTMVTYQVFIPTMDANNAPKAFDVEREVKPSRWVVLYKGTVVAPKDGTFRFLGYADDVMAVRFDRQNVFFAGTFGNTRNPGVQEKYFSGGNQRPSPPSAGSTDPGTKGVGKWFQVERGKSYPIEVMISEMPGGLFGGWLMIEDRNPEIPYPKRTFAPNHLAYPVFQTKKGVPVPPYVPPNMTPPPNASPSWRPSEGAPEVAPNPVVFPGK